MPVYTYRREDGTTFDYRQAFSDDPLQVDPTTGQKVTRVVQATGVIFKGSGFYVNDSKGAKSTTSTPKADAKADGKAEPKAESKAEAPAPAPAPTSTTTSSAAD